MSETITAQQPRKRRRWDQPAQDETNLPTKGSAPSTPSVDGANFQAPAPLGPPQPSPPNQIQPPPKRRSRWDDSTGPLVAMTPNVASYAQTPVINSSVPMGGMMVPMGAATPIGTPAMMMATPAPGHMIPMTPEVVQALRQEREIDERNRPLSDQELDDIFAQTLGDRAKDYKVVTPPEDYKPIRTPARKILPTATPFNIAGGLMTPAGALGVMTPAPGQAGFFMQSDEGHTSSSNKMIPNLEPKDLPPMKPEDLQYFDKLLTDVDEKTLSADEQRDRKIMRLLFKIKNGSPMMRKAALRQITDKAREFGAEPLFKQILPLLMSPALEDQERHLLVKVIDRILYKLDDLVRPHVKPILVVIEPLLIEEDYYARVEGREIISNLAKAAGLATMISTMRPDIDNIDEYVRNTTARAFAVVASALGIPSLLPFLEAVCRSKKSWQARHTGIKIVQQIAFLMGCAVLPYSASLTKTIAHGLGDEQQKVKTMTALAIAALAESSAPYGIESFDIIIRPLFDGIKVLHGKGLAAFLKAVGHLIPLMEPEDADFYTRQIERVLLREFASPDEEMKKIVLKVVKQCYSKEGVDPKYIKERILPDFFKHFWTANMAMDKRNYRQLVDTTVELGNRVGAGQIVVMIVKDLTADNEQLRKMVMETIDKVLTNLGASEIDERLEQRLMDGIIHAFQEQSADDYVMLSGFGAVVQSLGKRVTPYLSQIKGVIEFRLGNASAKTRQQAADFMSKIASVMRDCEREDMLMEMGKRFYENLGEEYPEVLGSILGALKAIVSVIGMEKMDPPIRDLLPRLTPILKNRHEKVQENCIDLVGRIADRGAEYVSAREWMRICFELLELLKAHKKAIRRATVNTFGYIAKAIGTHDVLATLLNNLRVQERQNRVCTTVAIAIVAETCGPFAVLAALMNEYRVPELNVQNGVLKSLSFLFQYIGEMGKDYIYAVTPLLEDALVDRDLVHRQTALSAIQHMALGVFGYGCEDALIHLLNLVWPNIFETSPHLVQAFMGTIEALRLSLGPMRLLQYVLQGLFHPARKVRDVYWRVYNTLYIGAQDALVAAYPRLETAPHDSAIERRDPHSHNHNDTEQNEPDYARYELDYVF